MQLPLYCSCHGGLLYTAKRQIIIYCWLCNVLNRITYTQSIARNVLYYFFHIHASALKRETENSSVTFIPVYKYINLIIDSVHIRTTPLPSRHSSPTRLIVQVYRSYTPSRTPPEERSARSGGCYLHRNKTGFESATPAIQRPQTYALNLTATWDRLRFITCKYIQFTYVQYYTYIHYTGWSKGLCAPDD
jgi:hypothetical protein